MSAGNGQRGNAFVTIDQHLGPGWNARVEQDRPLSASERERERLAMRDQIVTLTRQVMALTEDREVWERLKADYDGHIQWHFGLERRIDAIERHAATHADAFRTFMARTFWTKLRWLFRG